MKRSILALAVLVGVVGAIAWRSIDTSGRDANRATTVLEVRGMSSPMCELDVRSTLAAIEGVDDVSINRDEAKAVVRYDPASGGPEAFVHAVEARGYGVSVLEQSESAHQHSASVACDNPALCDRETKETSLSQEQVTRVSNYVFEQLIATERIPSTEDILNATGVDVSSQDVAVLQQAVVARLAEDPKGRKLLEGSRCSRFEACSFSRILSTATGKQLELYQREKAEDGREYADFSLPEFEAHDLSNNPVKSSDLVGQPTVLVFLAQHCNHSVESLPILTELAQQFGPQGFKVVGVFVNSGTAEEVKYWVSFHQPEYAGQYDVWVIDDISVGDVVGSHLTPTYFMVDVDGRVQKKLVGFKSRDKVFAELSARQTLLRGQA